MQRIELEKEITPAHMRCMPAQCPAVFTLTDGNLLIIGKKPSEDLHEQIAGKVGEDEFAVVLSPDFFQELHIKS